MLATLWEQTPVKITLQELGIDAETVGHFRRVGLKEVNTRGRVHHEILVDIRVSQNRYVNIL